MKYDLINTKTWNGRKWMIVDEERNPVVLSSGVAQFPLSNEGLKKAREVLKDLKRRIGSK